MGRRSFGHRERTSTGCDCFLGKLGTSIEAVGWKGGGGVYEGEREREREREKTTKMSFFEGDTVHQKI